MHHSAKHKIYSLAFPWLWPWKCSPEAFRMILRSVPDMIHWSILLYWPISIWIGSSAEQNQIAPHLPSVVLWKYSRQARVNASLGTDYLNSKYTTSKKCLVFKMFYLEANKRVSLALQGRSYGDTPHGSASWTGPKYDQATLFFLRFPFSFLLVSMLQGSQDRGTSDHPTANPANAVF